YMPYKVEFETGTGWVDDEHIELVTTPATPATQPQIADTTGTAIVCLIKDGQPLPSKTPHVHDNPQAALKEAKRLANKHRGEKFGVYTMATSAINLTQRYEHEWQRLAAEGFKISAIKELRRVSGLYLRAAKYAVEDYIKYGCREAV